MSKNNRNHQIISLQNDNFQRVQISHEASHIEFDKIKFDDSIEEMDCYTNDNDLLMQLMYPLASSSHENTERTISIDPQEVEKMF